MVMTNLQLCKINQHLQLATCASSPCTFFNLAHHLLANSITKK